MDQKRIGELEHKINTDYGNTTGVVVLKEGKLVYEKYFNGCTRESQVHVYSVTKSIISILIGIAVDKGYIQSIDQKVLDFFPEYVVLCPVSFQSITGYSLASLILASWALNCQLIFTCSLFLFTVQA